MTIFGTLQVLAFLNGNVRGYLFQHCATTAFRMRYHTLLCWCPNLLFDRVISLIYGQLLAEHEYVVCFSLFYDLQETYCGIHRHIHVTGSVPHTLLTKNCFWFHFLFPMNLMTLRCSAPGVTRPDAIF